MRFKRLVAAHLPVALVEGLALKGLGGFLRPRGYTSSSSPHIRGARVEGESVTWSYVHESGRRPLLARWHAVDGKYSGVFSIPAPFDSSASVRGPHCFRV